MTLTSEHNILWQVVGRVSKSRRRSGYSQLGGGALRPIDYRLGRWVLRGDVYVGVGVVEDSGNGSQR